MGFNETITYWDGKTLLLVSFVHWILTGVAGF